MGLVDPLSLEEFGSVLDSVPPDMDELVALSKVCYNRQYNAQPWTAGAGRFLRLFSAPPGLMSRSVSGPKLLQLEKYAYNTFCNTFYTLDNSHEYALLYYCHPPPNEYLFYRHLTTIWVNSSVPELCFRPVFPLSLPSSHMIS